MKTGFYMKANENWIDHMLTICFCMKIGNLWKIVNQKYKKQSKNYYKYLKLILINHVKHEHNSLVGVKHVRVRVNNNCAIIRICFRVKYFINKKKYFLRNYLYSILEI